NLGAISMNIRKVVNWLTLTGATNVRAVYIVVENGKTREKLIAVEYIQENEARYYVLGEKPKYMNRGVLTIAGRDWYCAYHSTQESLKPDYEKYHPFGHSWGLFCWSVPNEAIDKYEDKPYNR